MGRGRGAGGSFGVWQGFGQRALVQTEYGSIKAAPSVLWPLSPSRGSLGLLGWRSSRLISSSLGLLALSAWARDTTAHTSVLRSLKQLAPDRERSTVDFFLARFRRRGCRRARGACVWRLGLFVRSAGAVARRAALEPKRRSLSLLCSPLSPLPSPLSPFLSSSLLLKSDRATVRCPRRGQRLVVRRHLLVGARSLAAGRPLLRQEIGAAQVAASERAVAAVAQATRLNKRKRRAPHKGLRALVHCVRRGTSRAPPSSARRARRWSAAAILWTVSRTTSRRGELGQG